MDPTPYFAKYGAVGNMWGAVKAYLERGGRSDGRAGHREVHGRARGRGVFTPEVGFGLMESMRLNRGIGLQVHP